jgi:hypothetical protein
MKKKSLIVFGITLISIIGCTKEGPIGPAGNDGNANVVSSTFSSSNWVYSAPSWSLTHFYSAITQEIIDKGAVLVYLKTGQAYSQLPITIYTSTNYSTSIEVASFVGGVKLFWTDSDLTQPNNPGNLEFKIVVIAASGLAQNPNLDFTNYEEVAQAYNLNKDANMQFVK